ncbi:hypothetical protein EDB89DRAFT_1904768 [Lactarius sanguifluus]|nr:hypothetical protein EDB89DRAFT_1904768 [Lactarius sanguifluus]
MAARTRIPAQLRAPTQLVRVENPSKVISYALKTPESARTRVLVDHAIVSLIERNGTLPFDCVHELLVLWVETTYRAASERPVSGRKNSSAKIRIRPPALLLFPGAAHYRSHEAFFQRIPQMPDPARRDAPEGIVGHTVVQPTCISSGITKAAQPPFISPAEGPNLSIRARDAQTDSPNCAKRPDGIGLNRNTC